MQRKSCILKKQHRKCRDAMALIMAMAVIVIIAAILALSISLSTLTTKKTADI